MSTEQVHSVSGLAKHTPSRQLGQRVTQCALLKLRANGCSGVGIGTFAFCAEPTGTFNLLTRPTTQPGAHSL
jgi:hypothetical protein